MNKLTFALALLNRIRTEKNPPLARYCCLLTLAENPGQRMTAHEVFRRFGIPEALFGTLDNAVRQELVTETRENGRNYYCITPKGEEIARQLLSPPDLALPPAKRKQPSTTRS